MVSIAIHVAAFLFLAWVALAILVFIYEIFN